MGYQSAATAARASGYRSGPTARTANVVTSAANRNRLSADDLLRLNTGWRADPEIWRKGQARRQVIRDQTERIAAALESQGIRAHQMSPVTALANVTGETDTQDGYRPICFLPAVAQREAGPTLNRLQYFLLHEGGRHVRYAVVTSGPRLTTGLRSRIQGLHRTVSRWAHEAEKDWGVEVIFRRTEFTRDARGSYHPHANVLYRPRARMSHVQWASFLIWSRRRLGAVWHDAGEIRDLSEVVKYPFKPADVAAASAEELAWLYLETFRLKLSQPMGAFADFCRQLDRAGEKVASINRGSEVKLEIVAKAKRERSGEADPADDGENRILCRTAPSFRFGPYAQPITLLQNYTTSPRTVEGARRLAIIRAWNAEARVWWDRNGAPEPAAARAVAAGQIAAHEGEAARIAVIRVHTCSPTVQGRRSTLAIREGQKGPQQPPLRSGTAPDSTSYDLETGEIFDSVP